MTSPADPAEPKVIDHDGFRTSYLDVGPPGGVPVLAIHGSGPGVSAAANWRGLLESEFARSRRILAPDVVGFGASAPAGDRALTHWARVEQLIGFVEALGVESVDVLGNSMGGGLALAIAHRRPEMVRSMVLMGSVGVEFPITEGLAKVWGYRPELAAMREIMGMFAYDPSIVSEQLVQLRYETSLQPVTRAFYEAAFTEPLQQHVAEMALSPEELAAITVPTLLVHGAEDRIVPLRTSLDLVRLLPQSDLIVFGHCGHWTQIERSADFIRHVADFFQAADDRAGVAPAA